MLDVFIRRYLRGDDEKMIDKEILLKYLKKRRDSIKDIMIEHFKITDEVDCCQLEVYLTYNAMISDVKNDRIKA